MNAHTCKIDAFENKGRNLYKTGAGYWRLFANGVTPNGCWLINARMVELKDIDVATGADIFGDAEVELECVPFGYEYVYYNPNMDFHFNIQSAPANVRKS